MMFFRQSDLCTKHNQDYWIFSINIQRNPRQYHDDAFCRGTLGFEIDLRIYIVDYRMKDTMYSRRHNKIAFSDKIRCIHAAIKMRAAMFGQKIRKCKH
jgi:hypothetical protein